MSALRKVRVRLIVETRDGYVVCKVERKARVVWECLKASREGIEDRALAGYGSTIKPCAFEVFDVVEVRSWSGADLAGGARRYGDVYKRSRAALIARARRQSGLDIRSEIVDRRRVATVRAAGGVFVL